MKNRTNLVTMKGDVLTIIGLIEVKHNWSIPSNIYRATKRLSDAWIKI